MSDNDRIEILLRDNLGSVSRGFNTNVVWCKKIKFTLDKYIYFDDSDDPTQDEGSSFDHHFFETGYVLTGFKTKDNTVLNLNTVYTIASLNNATNITSQPYSEDPTKTLYVLELEAIWEFNEDLIGLGKTCVSAMYLKEIANAVRYKNGLSRGYKLSELPNAIRDLGGE